MERKNFSKTTKNEFGTITSGVDGRTIQLAGEDVDITFNFNFAEDDWSKQNSFDIDDITRDDTGEKLELTDEIEKQILELL